MVTRVSKDSIIKVKDRIKPYLVEEPVYHPDLLKNKEPLVTGKELLVLMELYMISHADEPSRLVYTINYERIFDSGRKESMPTRLERMTDLKSRLVKHGKQDITLDKSMVREILGETGIHEKSIFLLDSVAVGESAELILEINKYFKKVLVALGEYFTVGERRHYLMLQEAPFYIRFYVEIRSLQEVVDEHQFTIEELHDILQVAKSYRESYKEFNRSYLKKIDKKFPDLFHNWERLDIKEGKNVVAVRYKFGSNKEINKHKQLTLFDSQATVDIEHQLVKEQHYNFEHLLLTMGFNRDYVSRLSQQVQKGERTEEEINYQIFIGLAGWIRKDSTDKYNVKFIRKCIDQKWTDDKYTPHAIGPLPRNLEEFYKLVLSREKPHDPQVKRKQLDIVLGALNMQLGEVYSPMAQKYRSQKSFEKQLIALATTNFIPSENKISDQGIGLIREYIMEFADRWGK